MKKIFSAAFMSLSFLHLHAQDAKPPGRGRLQSVSASLLFPLGNFPETHFGGVGLEYSWFGKSLPMRREKKQNLMFTANGGVAFYAGKNEKVGTASYKYPMFTFIHAYGGAAWRPVNHMHVGAIAGPALGIYNGHSAFNLGGRLDAQYYISGTLSMGPSIQFMKENGSDALWTASVGVHYYF